MGFSEISAILYTKGTVVFVYSCRLMDIDIAIIQCNIRTIPWFCDAFGTGRIAAIGCHTVFYLNVLIEDSSAQGTGQPDAK